MGVLQNYAHFLSLYVGETSYTDHLHVNMCDTSKLGAFDQIYCLQRPFELMRLLRARSGCKYSIAQGEGWVYHSTGTSQGINYKSCGGGADDLTKSAPRPCPCDGIA